MARAYGWNANLLMGFEKAYGVKPNTKYYRVPFISSSLDSEQGLIESNVLGAGRDPTAPFQDTINVDGDMVIPVELRNIGMWLMALLGQSQTEIGRKCHMHIFKSGQSSLPSISLEVGLPDVPDYPLFSGVRVNSMAFNFERTGEPQVTVNLLGQSETSSEQTQSVEPSMLPYTRFSQFQGSIKHKGKFLADVTGASITYSNNFEKIETIRNDGKVDGIDAGIAALSGNISVRYSNKDLMDLARSGQPIDIELAYTIHDEAKLVLIAHAIYLPKAKRTINGAGGVEASYDFQGAKSDAAGCMFTVKLFNDVKSYQLDRIDKSIEIDERDQADDPNDEQGRSETPTPETIPPTTDNTSSAPFNSKTIGESMQDDMIPENVSDEPDNDQVGAETLTPETIPPATDNTSSVPFNSKTTGESMQDDMVPDNASDEPPQTNDNVNAEQAAESTQIDDAQSSSPSQVDDASDGATDESSQTDDDPSDETIVGE